MKEFSNAIGILQMMCGCDSQCAWHIDRDINNREIVLCHYRVDGKGGVENIRIGDEKFLFRQGDTRTAKQILIITDIQHQDWELEGWREYPDGGRMTEGLACPEEDKAPEEDKIFCEEHSLEKVCLVCSLEAVKPAAPSDTASTTGTWTMAPTTVSSTSTWTTLDTGSTSSPSVSSIYETGTYGPPIFPDKASYVPRIETVETRKKGKK